MIDIAVIGGGSAGMITAGTLANKKKNVVLIERNQKVGRKLMITGKGRCNITNACTKEEFIESVVTNKKFLYSAISAFSPQDTVNFFESLGLKTKVERGKRVFPVSDRAVDVVDTLYRFVKSSGCKLLFAKVEKITYSGEKFTLFLSDGTQLMCNKVVLACGGVSYPQTGSDGHGLKLAQSLGHKITELKPSLVPLVSSSKHCKSLQGLSLKNVKINVINKKSNRLIYSDFGEMLFTHFGLSGPIILSASSHIKNINDGYRIDIDLKPALTVEQLDKRLQREFAKNNNKSFVNILGNLVPRKLIPVLIKEVNISPHIKCNSITKLQRQAVIDFLKGFSVDIIGFRPIEEAVVTSGGVSVKEINPKTMESKLVKGLYFAGEMIDVDAYTGGFNLQIAFSTGYLVATSL